MLALQPILADIGGLITIAFLVISFIGWLSNLVSKQQEANKPQKQRRPQDRKVRDEIEAFLQEATGQQRPRPQRAAREADVLSADDVEVVSSRPPQRSKPNRPQPQRKQPPTRTTSQTKPAKPTATAASPARTAPGQQAAQRQVQNSDLGQSLSQHVQQHMAERVGDQAARDVDTQVDDHVAARMGQFAAEIGAVGRGGSSSVPVAGELLKLLRTPQGVKQAYILGEVLQPPIAMRRSRNK